MTSCDFSWDEIVPYEISQTPLTMEMENSVCKNFATNMDKLDVYFIERLLVDTFATTIYILSVMPL